MIHEAIKNAIQNGSLMLRANRYEFYEMGKGIDEGETDAEFFIGLGPIRTHFEIDGINEQFISSNFWMDNRSKIVSDEGKIELKFDWKPSKNSENEPTSIDFFIENDKVVSIKFWFMAGFGGSAHIRTISFDVVHIEYCPNCYHTFEIDFLSKVRKCPHCGNVKRLA